MGVFDFDQPPEIDSWTSKLALALFTCIVDVIGGDVALVHCKKYPEPSVCSPVRLFRILPSLGFGVCRCGETVSRMAHSWERSLTGKKFTFIYITISRTSCMSPTSSIIDAEQGRARRKGYSMWRYGWHSPCGKWTTGLNLEYIELP